MVDVEILGIPILIATICCVVATLASRKMERRTRRRARQQDSADSPHESTPENKDVKKVEGLLADTLDPTTANHQSQSPFFSIIPAEIRNRIFSFALRTFDDKAQPYELGTFWARPETSHRRKLDTTLLLTCRRIYLETYILPCFQYETNYWWGRGPSPEKTRQNPIDYLKKLTPAQRARSAVNVFIQQYELEGGFKSNVMVRPDFRPAHLKFTLRHTDWWFWERSEQLCLDPRQSGRPNPYRYGRSYARQHENPFAHNSWGVCLTYIDGLQTFSLELETVNTKKNELDGIVAWSRGWIFPMRDGAYLVPDLGYRKVSEWKGIDRFYELENGHPPRSQENQAAAPQELTYYVVELRWKRTIRDPVKDSRGEEWKTTTAGILKIEPPRENDSRKDSEEDLGFGLFD